MSPRMICCSACCARWPSAGAADARVEIIVMPWTMPIPVTSIAVRARTIAPPTHIYRSGHARLLLRVFGNLCARHQTP